ncbi:hypothetical protein IEO21_07810 [Rhodonia placenta]|uniref:Uncharacterized protein n=1 Tax=Rhodonia placenta TaxID=104341 RepID=A0A8H7TZZ0_9APHY|nr:hypothetical protein IEO21_07810 [Postia placenta]
MPWCSFQDNCVDYACVGQYCRDISNAATITTLSALLIYHVALNLPHDVRRLWGRRSIATLLSAINWLAITGTIITLMPLPQSTTQVGSIYLIIYPTRCASYTYAYEVGFFVNTAIFPLVAALRVHAVSGRNWRWVFPVWLLGMVPVSTNTWRLTQETLVVIPQLGCTTSVSMSKAVFNMYVTCIVFANIVDIITRASVVISDILVVAATWSYISHTSSVKAQLVRDMWTTRPNLTTVMFRDGTLYFLIISLLNLGDLIVTIITVSSVWRYLLTESNLACYRMSSILISRFLICIREAAERSTQAFGSQSLSFIDSQDSASPQPWLSSVEFASDIANHSAEDGLADAFPDLDDNGDNLDSGAGEDARIPEDENGIEMDEYAAGGQQSPLV